ncbi:MAG: adenylosuccinate synthase [Porphyromonas sp.]|nr:adenylosuccinate synthase [Porphyromonas sp.]
MNKVDILLGLQWGDEGKGKVVDVLTPRYDMVARFQGGPNAGHTLEFDDKKFVLRSIPSGVFQGGKINIIGNGVVLDPVLFKEEAEGLESSGIPLKKELLISKKAHLILPTHRVMDAANEKAKGDKKVGTTGKGIGPTYTDKISRNGIRVGDLLSADFMEKFKAAKQRHITQLTGLGTSIEELAPDYDALESKWLESLEYLKSYQLVSGEFVVNNYIKEGKSVLAEGAQGSMLDIDYGSYPFVTSSNTISAGACTGLGIAPSKIGRVFGIFKAYCTRVGAGPFPTELFDATGDKMCEIGREFGSVTGRKRRCGWVDLVALKYTTMLNGVTDLIMMKSDVMDTFDEVKLCVAYEINGERTDEMPFELTDEVKPVYETLEGWKTDMTRCTAEEQFSKPFNDYIKFIESYLGIPIRIVSVGPDREQTIIRAGF